MNSNSSELEQVVHTQEIVTEGLAGFGDLNPSPHS